MKKNSLLVFMILALAPTPEPWAEPEGPFPPESAISGLQSQAQQVEETHAASKKKLLTVEARLVLADATVKDAKGKPMAKLKQKDFKVFEDGYPQEIKHFSRDEMPLAVALALDVSGCPPASTYKNLRKAAKVALDHLKKADRIAVFDFSNPWVRRGVPLTGDRDVVYNHIAGLEIDHNSVGGNINDAVDQAIRYLDKAPEAKDSRKAIIISENGGYNSRGNSFPSQFRLKHEELVSEALETDVSIYSIQLHVPDANEERIREASRTMGFTYVRDLVWQTGGEMFTTATHSPSDIGDALELIVDDLKLRYTLGYYPSDHPDPSPPQKTEAVAKTKLDAWNDVEDSGSRKIKEAPVLGKRHRIDVELIPEYGKKGVQYTIMARRGYYAGKTAEAAK